MLLRFFFAGKVSLQHWANVTARVMLKNYNSCTRSFGLCLFVLSKREVDTIGKR